MRMVLSAVPGLAAVRAVGDGRHRRESRLPSFPPCL